MHCGSYEIIRNPHLESGVAIIIDDMGYCLPRLTIDLKELVDLLDYISKASLLVNPATIQDWIDSKYDKG